MLVDTMIQRAANFMTVDMCCGALRPKGYNMSENCKLDDLGSGCDRLGSRQRDRSLDILHYCRRRKKYLATDKGSAQPNPANPDTATDVRPLVPFEEPASDFRHACAGMHIRRVGPGATRMYQDSLKSHGFIWTT